MRHTLWMVSILAMAISLTGIAWAADEYTEADITPERVRNDPALADWVVRHPNLDKFLERHPYLGERLCVHPRAASTLARHPRLGRLLSRHPGLAQGLAQHPESAEEFAQHPQAAKFLKDHPRIRQRLETHPGARRALERQQALRERQDQGVRDLGRGEGREGVGQGGEHRRWGPGTHGGTRPGGSPASGQRRGDR